MKTIDSVLAAVLLTVLFLLVMLVPSFADHVPRADDSMGGEGVVRVFGGGESVSLMGELKGGYLDGEDRGYGSLTAGPYVRLLENLKAGAFYRLQRGERHDDDWIALNPGWGWRDTGSRNEHVLIGDITPRFLAGFLPGGNWVFEVKARYHFNMTGDEETVTVRPGLTHFLFLGGATFMNIFLQYELSFPVNYGDGMINARWAYAGVIVHLDESFQAGIYGAYGQVTWNTSEDFERLRPGESYSVETRYLIAGMMAILRLKL